ncbi:UDP-GlcNAc--UDP-phosphate GlcNAc-1-phosphate transferase [Pedobacter sp. AW31-3R]|uniref:UDP-GlcNAc--UDP-phosphate GlcNAc-1-phosphate transferase n=1 Tax=Pedobacter sp. AW31-3R TaxID=3445781 RepID=UPI003F9F4CDB
MAELLYFKVADHYKITDLPNVRGSHQHMTIRGGGIIFPLAIFLYAVYFESTYVFFLAGLFLISMVSFIDDIKQVNNKVRLVIHLISVAFLFYQLDLFMMEWYLIAMAFFFTIGTINAVNFMDGINGITGGYSLVTLLTLFYINYYHIKFIDTNLLFLSVFSVIVFIFFNFRKRAKCFAGDVGSVAVGFTLVYLIISLMMKSGDLKYILLLLIYGLDVVSTIFFRIIRRERILEPHRTHFYQFLANEYGLAQLSVAFIYVFVQIIVNVILVNIDFNSNILLSILIFFSGIVFVNVRIMLEGRSRLLGSI